MMLDDRDIQIIASLLEGQKQELHAEIQAVQKSLSTDLRTQNQELHAEIQAVQKSLSTDLRTQNQELHAEIQTVQKSLSTDLRTETHGLRSEFLTVIESEVTPKLRLLAEGQDAILEKIVPASRIEALEADVVVLKDAVKYLSERLQALEKAQ